MPNQMALHLAAAEQFDIGYVYHTAAFQQQDVWQGLQHLEGVGDSRWEMMF